MSDGGEGAFDWVRRSDMFPMLGWDVIEGQEYVTIFGQFPHGFIVFHAVGCDEEVKSGLGIHVRLSLPYVVQMALCFGLNRLGHRIQNIAGFMEPASLLRRRAKDLTQRIPDPQSTVADGKIRRMGEASALQIKQQFTPAWTCRGIVPLL